MSEMAQTADHVIVVGKGRLLRDQSMAEFIAAAAADVVRVRSPHAGRLAEALASEGVTVRGGADGALEVQGVPSDRVGEIAARERCTLFELSTQSASLEQAYMALTGDSVDYRGHGTSEGKGRAA